jgi:hypothetical protein
VPPPLLILPDITQTDIAEIRAELGEIITITIVAGGSSSTRLSSPSLVSRRHPPPQAPRSKGLCTLMLLAGSWLVQLSDPDKRDFYKNGAQHGRVGWGSEFAGGM